MIVEDDRFISAIFTMFLREMGHELIGRCQNGQDALQLCAEARPDVVLMDIHIEGQLDGIQTAEQLIRHYDVPVIFVTSDTDSDIIKRAIVSNSYGYLIKPINRKELAISIDLAFYKHKADSELKLREKGYRQFISESPIPIAIVREGKIQYVNNNALNLLRTHYIEDVMGMPFLSFIDPEHQEVVSALIHIKEKPTQKLPVLQVQMRDVHGRPVVAEIKASCVEFNRKPSLQLILRDISHEHVWHHQMNAYRHMLKQSGTSYFLTTPDWVLHDASEDLREFFTQLEGVRPGGSLKLAQFQFGNSDPDALLIQRESMGYEPVSGIVRFNESCLGAYTAIRLQLPGGQTAYLFVAQAIS